MFTQGQGISFFYRQSVEASAGLELAQELYGFGAGYNLDGGILIGHLADEGRMIRLHVMHHQIVGRTAIQSLLKVLQPLLSFPAVGRIKNGHFLILDQIRVIGHALRHNILAFKEVQIQVVHPDIEDSFGDFVHICFV